MFLVNKLAKMKHTTRLGSRIAEVHNGSSLFTGDAGQGESNIRRWIIENDWLEAIIALPENMFYNTGIATYIWLLTNRKPDSRKGRVQLIDATEWFVPLRRNLGKKNCAFSEEHIRMICDLVMNPVETEKSMIFSNEAFGYWKVTVEQPLRLAADLSPERLKQFEKTCIDANEQSLSHLIQHVVQSMGDGPHLDFNVFIKACKTDAKKRGIKLTARRLKLLQRELCERNENAKPVIRKVLKQDTAPDLLRGRFEITLPSPSGRGAGGEGSRCVVEFEPDTTLRDSEQIPLLESGGIESFFRREVLPYTPDAWIDESKTQTGYEISFTRHFYKPAPMRTLDKIKADIYALEQETEGLLEQIVGEADK